MTIRVGVLGAGWVANERHLPGYRADKRAEVVAVFDRNAERAVKTAEAFGVGVGTDDLVSFFDQRPDVVSVCSSPFSHAELTIEALSRGCHVLTEKPMAMNSAEALLMADRAREADRILCVSHNFLFSRAVRQADAALHKAGPIQYSIGLQLSSDRRRLPVWRDELPGGLFFDEVPHLLYLLQHYLGALELDTVRVRRRSERGHPILTEIQVSGERGPGQMTVMSGAPLAEWHVTVIGQTGVVDIDLFRDIAVRLGSDRSHRPIDVLRTSTRAIAEHIRGFVSSGMRLTTGRLLWGHGVLIRRFLDATTGQGPPPVDLEDSLRIVALTDDILAALEEG